MAKKYAGTDFNFGYNVKPKKSSSKGKKGKSTGKKKSGNPWQQYVGGK